MYGASSISNGAVQKYDPFKSTMCNRIPINTELLLLASHRGMAIIHFSKVLRKVFHIPIKVAVKKTRLIALISSYFIN